MVSQTWLRTNLGSCFDSITSGTSLVCEDEPAAGNAIGILKTSAVSDGRFLPNQNKLLKLPSDRQPTTPVRGGTLVVCRSNSPDLVGSVGFVPEDNPNLYLSDKLWQLVPTAGMDGEFLAALISSDEVQMQVRSAANGSSSSMQNISKEDFSGIEVLVPDLPNQQRIAAILRTWDAAIDLAQTEVELYATQLRGMREKLILWRSGPHKKLRSALQAISRAVDKPTTPYTALGIRSHGKGTFLRRVEDPTTVEMDTLYVALTGDLIVNITFAWEGAVAIVVDAHDGALVSHRFPTFVPNPEFVFTPFLRHVIRMPRFTYLMSLVSPGGAGRNRVLNKDAFLDLEVPLPSLSRQKAVAIALDDIERGSILAIQKRDALRRQKRGLLQKLLAGERGMGSTRSKKATNG